VAYENQIVMTETLETGLAELFGGAPLPRPPDPGAARANAQAPTAGTAPVSDDLTDLASRARGAYDRAVAAQRAGDWATYGRELEALGDLLEQMREP